MLQYTFSAREKFMLGVLVVIAIVIVWYQFLYTPLKQQAASLDTQIEQTKQEIGIKETDAANLARMEKANEEYAAQGITPVYLPNFDNTQQLMAYLNGVLSVTTSYSMNWDNPQIADDGTVHRSGSITFVTSSYESARSVIQNVARGPYPCTVKSVGINDGTVKSSSSSKGSTVRVNMSVMFLEHRSTGTDLEEEESESGVEGHDLSVLWRDDAKQ